MPCTGDPVSPCYVTDRSWLQSLQGKGLRFSVIFTYFGKPGEFFGSVFTIQVVKRVSLQHKNWELEQHMGIWL